MQRCLTAHNGNVPDYVVTGANTCHHPASSEPAPWCHLSHVTDVITDTGLTFPAALLRRSVARGSTFQAVTISGLRIVVVADTCEACRRDSLTGRRLTESDRDGSSAFLLAIRRSGPAPRGDRR